MCRRRHIPQISCSRYVRQNITSKQIQVEETDLVLGSISPSYVCNPYLTGGMPGPYIKWFQEKLKSEGLYKILAAYEDKSATAVCTLAFCPAPHADPVLFTGECHGTIVEPQEGRGFGWDSIFLPNGSDRPFSQMTTDEKNNMSHRGKAVRKWADWLGNNLDELFERQEGKPAIGHKGLNFRATTPEQ